MGGGENGLLVPLIAIFINRDDCSRNLQSLLQAVGFAFFLCPNFFDLYKCSWTYSKPQADVNEHDLAVKPGTRSEDGGRGGGRGAEPGA